MERGGPGVAGQGNGPFREFSYEDLITRDKVNLDITWMKDPARDDADSDLPPEVITEEIVRDSGPP